MQRSAIFSADQLKRFVLIRDWSDEELLSRVRRIVNFIMLNPSKAGAEIDDTTVRKCVGFAKRWGFTRAVITNLIPVVSTDPWALLLRSGVDMRNTAVLKEWMCKADLVVAAWGTQPKAVARNIQLTERVNMLQQIVKVKLYCIGMTASGQPLHPSRAAYTTKPILWKAT